MSIRSIGSGPLGMDDISQSEPSLESGAPLAQKAVVDKSSVSALGDATSPVVAEVLSKTSPLSPAEAGVDRLGESKFQGMMVRDNLQLSSRAIIDDNSKPGVWAEKFGKGELEVQDNLSFPKVQVFPKGEIQGHLDTAKGGWAGVGVQHDLSLPNQAAIKMIDIQDKLSFPKLAAIEGAIVQDKLSFPKMVASQQSQPLETIEPVKERPAQVGGIVTPAENEWKWTLLGDKTLAVTENLSAAGQPNIWGERLAGDSESAAGLDVHDKLNFPKQMQSLIGGELEVQDKDHLSRMATKDSGGVLEGKVFPKKPAV